MPQPAVQRPSLSQCFLDAIDRYANPRAQVFRGAKGWEAIPAAEMLRRVAGLSKALFELGIRTGDRVAVFAPNCPEWHIADFAIQGLGGVTVPVYFNESPGAARLHSERFRGARGGGSRRCRAFSALPNAARS